MHYREVGRRRTGENALSTWSANEGPGRRVYVDLGLAAFASNTRVGRLPPRGSRFCFTVLTLNSERQI